jgi:hypothetical protein
MGWWLFSKVCEKSRKTSRTIINLSAKRFELLGKFLCCFACGFLKSTTGKCVFLVSKIFVPMIYDCVYFCLFISAFVEFRLLVHQNSIIVVNPEGRNSRLFGSGKHWDYWLFIVKTDYRLQGFSRLGFCPFGSGLFMNGLRRSNCSWLRSACNPSSRPLFNDCLEFINALVS